MPGFENYSREAEEIEREIARKGLVLGIDWQDEAQVQALAREALAYRDPAGVPERRADDARALAKIELFGLAQLMLTVMRQSADEGMFTHGGAVWKAFARALWQEAGEAS
ncbi:MAG: hypothetical protein PHY45_01345 [Rhodocyclaceae bacterium]|nr:hypothetical protein [Rhodocyclaceae bacterium]